MLLDLCIIAPIKHFFCDVSPLRLTNMYCNFKEIFIVNGLLT